MNSLVRAVLGTIALAAVGGGAWYAYRAASTQPIREVAFSGDTTRIAQGELEQLAANLRALAPGGDTLVAVREAAKRVPWVREASARRRFPDGVEVKFELHEALARWGDGQLVSPRGEVFAARSEVMLPRFTGPEGAAPGMAREYPALARALSPLGSPVAEVRLSARGAWQVTLDSGLVLELGRGELVKRIERFAAAWPQIAKSEPVPRYADLRYPNGFALRRARDPNDIPSRPAPKAKPRLTQNP